MNMPLAFIEHHTPEVAFLTLNRPEKRNALSCQLLEQLIACFAELKASSTLRIAIIRGAGAIFCAGLDLEESTDHEKVEHSSQLLSTLFSTLESFPLVTIAAVQGAAVAGGAGIVAACDFAIATTEARFGFPEVRRGLVAAQVAPLLVQQLPWRSVQDLLLLGEMIDAKHALQLNFVNKVVPPETLMEQALKMAHLLCLGAPKAIASTKELLKALKSSPFSADQSLVLSYHRAARLSSEAQEGIQAFFEKRKPTWVSQISERDKAP